MGLDVYAGSLTRYYAGEWETAVQKYARENNMECYTVRTAPSASAGDPMTPEEICEWVKEWVDGLNIGLGDNLDQPLEWEESLSTPYFTDKPAWDCYSSLLLWAAYSEHPELTVPFDCIKDWSADEAYIRSTNPEFRSKYGALLYDVEMWLPSKFDFVFKGPNANGATIGFGSAVALLEQLNELNSRTWGADEATLVQWRKHPVDNLAPLEEGAKFAFAIFHWLASAAVEHKLVIKLDY